MGKILVYMNQKFSKNKETNKTEIGLSLSLAKGRFVADKPVLKVVFASALV